ncbi:MAG: ribosomal L7Ae/L30e/S12e/Gadd45 family protein [Lachnospiraceae bacterium]|jgi:ribosomal protein L7Ae-like RNA K-turn-binding protein|nr:ribosomal L7Ae/L30e/S12e/Gadd45 family protein [Lachnospiraceae bacterium]
MLGLCTKAGKLKSGEFQTESSVKSGEAFLVIVAGDASDNTKKKFNDMCTFYETPIIEYGLKEEMAKAIGKDVRAMLAVCDEGFAKSILKIYNMSNDNLED